ncbi:MAG: MopE-related protein [Myxococcota bacterium]
MGLLLLQACLWISNGDHKGRIGGDSASTPDSDVDTDVDADTDADVDADTDTDTSLPEDADGDGYTSEQAGGDDCNDGDPQVHPNAGETCNTDYDDDCDGVTDEQDAEGCTVWYQDGDEDGYGDAAVGRCGCEANGSFSTQDGSDCDDTDAGVHPSRTETCSTSHDDDCDGDTNEEAADGCTEWHPDADGDGFGDSALARCACVATPEFSVVDATDCDDADGGVNPDALETCATSGDDDCDGETNEQDAVGCSVWYLDADGDSYGNPAAGRCGCDAYGAFSTRDTSDCDDLDGSVNPSATEVCDNGIDDDCDSGPGGCAIVSASLAASDAEYTGASAADWAGSSVAAAGDVDGDGFGDFVVGSPSRNSSTGAAYLVAGAATPTSTSLSMHPTFSGSSVDDSAGWSVAGAGDVDGDGLDDLLVGSHGRGDSGSAFLLLAASATSSRSLTSSDAEYTGESPGDYAGYAVAGAGDVDGDGFADLLVGAVDEEDAGADAGAAYVILGSTSPWSGSLAYADSKLTAESPADNAGAAVASAGDFDGDGWDDLAVGATYGGVSDEGAAYLFLGGAVPSAASLGSADAAFLGEAANDAAGSRLASGDFNADGYADLLVGAYLNDDGGTAAGAAYLVLGHASPMSSYLASAGVQLTGEAAYDYAGFSVACAGDVDADGFEDILVGAHGNDDAGGFAGAAYLVRGSTSPSSTLLSSADAVFSGAATDDYAGYAVAGAGDVDADGYMDMLAAAPAADDGGGSAGTVYVVLGGGL